MCRQVTCRTCQKPSWAGCGAHVEQVLGHIPKAERCQGHTRSESKPPVTEGKGSLLDRIRRTVRG